MACEEAFIDCTTLSFSYDIYGIVTISYTMVHKAADFCYETTIVAGGQVFKGYVTDMSMNVIPGTTDWYETHVTLKADTER